MPLERNDVIGDRGGTGGGPVVLFSMPCYSAIRCHLRWCPNSANESSTITPRPEYDDDTFSMPTNRDADAKEGAKMTVGVMPDLPDTFG